MYDGVEIDGSHTCDKYKTITTSFSGVYVGETNIEYKAKRGYTNILRTGILDTDFIAMSLKNLLLCIMLATRNGLCNGRDNYYSRRMTVIMQGGIT
jgi:intein-encoded DNA endonuclease-like protein